MKETSNLARITCEVLQQCLKAIDHRIVRRCIIARNAQDLVRNPEVPEYICKGGGEVDARVRLSQDTNLQTR